MKNKKIINILSKSGTNGGLKVFVKLLMEELKKYKDYRLNLLLLKDNQTYEKFYSSKISKLSGLEVFDVEFINPTSLNISPNEILHVQDYSIGSIFALLFSNSLKIATIHSQMTNKTPYSGKFIKIKKLLDGFIQKTLIILMPLIFKKIIFLTKDQRKNFICRTLFKKKLGKKSIVINNFINSKVIKLKTKKNDLLKILFVGRLTYSKGYYDLLNVIKDKNLSDIKFNIVGKKKSNVKNKLKNVKYLGEIPNDKMFEIYDQNDILIFPSYSETFGLAILEAMARGLVVLASDLPAIREYFKDGRNGYLFPPGDIEKMKEIILYLKNNPKEIERISKNNLKDIHKFTAEKQVPKYIKVYEEILKESKNRK